MSSFKVLSILALITTICMLVLISLQFMELKYYNDTPSVWPTSPQ